MAKRIRIALIAAAMTLLLAMGAAAVNVHAADGDTATTTKPAAPTVNKTVKVAEGIKLPKTTFTFTATQYDADTTKDGIQNPDGTTQAAEATLQPVTVTYDGQTSSSKDLTQSVAFDLSKITATGEYTFLVAETNGKATGWTYDSQTYYLQVVVDKDGNQTYNITKTAGDTKNKETGFDFTNTYSKNASLSVTKKVTNSQYVDKNQTYSFTATFTDPSTSTIDVSKITVTGDATKVKADKDAKTITFELKDGETANFANVPAGAKVKVEETNTANIKNWKSASFSATSNGAEISQPTTTATSISDVLIGESTNSVTVANTFNDTTLTGVITQIAPFIAMVAIAGGAVALYLVSRKRREA